MIWNLKHHSNQDAWEHIGQRSSVPHVVIKFCHGHPLSHWGGHVQGRKNAFWNYRSYGRGPYVVKKRLFSLADIKRITVTNHDVNYPKKMLRVLSWRQKALKDLGSLWVIPTLFKWEIHIASFLISTWYVLPHRWKLWGCVTSQSFLKAAIQIQNWW